MKEQSASMPPSMSERVLSVVALLGDAIPGSWLTDGYNGWELYGEDGKLIVGAYPNEDGTWRIDVMKSVEHAA